MPNADDERREQAPTKPGKKEAPSLVLRKSKHVQIWVGEKPPHDWFTGLVVDFEGVVSRETIESGWALKVCGLNSAYSEGGSFRRRVSFAKAGQFVISATVIPYPGDPAQVADCRITLEDRPADGRRIRELSDRVVDASGEVDEYALVDLIRTRDLRAAPALWRVIDADPGGKGRPRHKAISTLGSIAHLDSVRRLILLLKDKGVSARAYTTLDLLGLEGPSGQLWRPVPTDEGTLDVLVEALFAEFHKKEPAWRKGLHQ